MKDMPRKSQVDPDLVGETWRDRTKRLPEPRQLPENEGRKPDEEEYLQIGLAEVEELQYQVQLGVRPGQTGGEENYYRAHNCHYSDYYSDYY